MHFERFRRRGLAIAVLVGAAGLALFFRIELANGFERTKGVPADGRLIHYLLEWEWLCFSGDPVCRDLWSPPSFFPEQGTLAFTDPSLGVGALYAAGRAIGLAPAPAFVSTQMLLLALAFASAYWMLARALRFSALPAAVGACLFAFGAPLAAHADHPQLFATFPIPLVLGALARLPEETERRRRWTLWAGVAAALAAQAWLNLTLFWLFSFFLTWLAIAALVLPGTRRQLLARARTDWAVAGGAGALAAAAVVPLLARMLAARERVGGAREVEKWFPFLPQPESWLNLSGQNWIWGWIADWSPIRDLHYPWEHELGIGVVTTVACLAAAWWGRRTAWALALALAVGAVGLLSLRWPGGFSLWTWVHAYWPGAESVRAVGRVALILLAPAAVALAFALERLREARRVVLAVALGAVALLEQQRHFESYSLVDAEARVAALAAQIPADCPAFYWSPLRGSFPGSVYQTQTEAMWAALTTRVPTANGYTGYTPSGWGLFAHRAENSQRQREIRDQLAFWAALTGLERGDLCWILTRGDGLGADLARIERPDPAHSPWPAPPGRTVVDLR